MFDVIHAQGQGGAVTEHFVFGERNSGTNLADALLKQNIPALAGSSGDRIGSKGFRYGWKHGFAQMVAAPESCLAVVLFRGPEVWLRSMHRRPWHVHSELRALGFSEFIRTEWRTVVDEQNFGVTKDGPRWARELQYDRHPITGARFENICALRNAKAAGHLGLARRFANVVMLRQEDLVADPEGFVRYVSERYGLGRYRDFRSVKARRGREQEGKFEPVAYETMSAEDTAFVWGALDEGQEARLGYGR